ncbi:MAG: hypothetical protein ABF633_03495 [Clostridium sp.]|uniref:hypothetical protein n=1 Tax=Clostridium sp. TaxID=1506 RepID=UPI0039EB08BF
MLEILVFIIQLFVMGLPLSYGLTHFAKGDYGIGACISVLFTVYYLVRAVQVNGADCSGE